MPTALARQLMPGSNRTARDPRRRGDALQADQLVVRDRVGDGDGRRISQQTGFARVNPHHRYGQQRHVEGAVIELAIANPALGQKRASWELQQKGIMVSSSGIGSIWLRNDLETIKKRLKALEARAAQEGILLTEEQMAALEKTRQQKEAHGEIESHHPGGLRQPGHLLYWHDERCGPYLPADLRRHLRPRGDLQAIHREDGNHGSGPAERPRHPVLCTAQE